MRIAKFAAFACLIFSGCAFNFSKYGQINPNEKSITVPRGGSNLTRLVKDSLAQSGWSVYTWTDSYRTTGTIGREVDLRGSSYGQARYSLKILSGNQLTTEARIAATVATCGLGFPCFLAPSIGNVNISVVDNKTGQEVLVITGGGYSDQLKQAIIQGLQ